MMSAIDIDELTDHIRRIAQEVVGRAQFKGTLVCTGYDKVTHSVKGILQPHGIETGWVPLAALHVGNGFGIVVGPRVGSADALDGQVFDVHFDGGDPDTLVAHHRQFSTQEQPPQVEPGEMLLQHESGNKIFFDQGNNLSLQHYAGAILTLHDDKSITFQHASGSMIAWDADGNITHDAKDKSISVAASQGGTIALGQGASGVTFAAPARLAAGSTMGGQGLQTG